MIALTGQRRVGKSYILRQLAAEIKAKNADANIIYINKEKKKFAGIKTDADLSEYLSDKLSETADNYPKYVISMDAISRPHDFDGITHLSLRQFLLISSF